MDQMFAHIPYASESGQIFGHAERHVLVRPLLAMTRAEILQADLA